MIKAIFFDIDGTLLSHTTGRVPESTEFAIHQLRKKGIRLFVATGRHKLEIEELPVNKLSFEGYITLNGQIYLNAYGKLTHSVPIKAADTLKMISIFERKEIPVLLVERNRMYINFVNESVCYAQEAISTPVPEVGIYRGDQIYQCIVFDDGSRVNTLIKELSTCKMSRWNPYGVDIISKEGGKVAGIRCCLQHFHLASSEIMAFGDGENDRDMLHYAGVGIAMGNADDIVKGSADYVTESVDRDGIYAALQHYKML